MKAHRGTEHRLVDLSLKNIPWQTAITACDEKMVSLDGVLEQCRVKLQAEAKKQLQNVEKSRERFKKHIDSLIAAIKREAEDVDRRLSACADRVQYCLGEIDSNRDSVQGWREKCKEMLDVSTNSDFSDNLSAMESFISETQKTITSINEMNIKYDIYNSHSVDNTYIKQLIGDITTVESHRVHNKAWDIACTPTGELIVGRADSDAIIYDADNKAKRTLMKPPNVTEWSPKYVSSMDDGILVSNNVRSGDGGCVMRYTHDGTFSHKVCECYAPRGVTRWRGRVVVIGANDEAGYVNVYDDKDGLLELKQTKKDQALPLAAYVTNNPKTQDLVVTYKSGVTALREDLEHRWDFPGESTRHGQLTWVRGVSVCQDGHVLINDRDAGRVLVLSPDGKFVREYRMPHQDKYYLQGLCVDKNNNVHVIDHHTGTMFKFRLVL